MPNVIHLLPDFVANQIAAGEVIQRPASVVKELIENAVDSGATSISVIVTNAGRTLIKIVDNGCGMSSTDARLSFERHATSKITKAEDLMNIRTKGFRGEALASIASVAMVEMVTRRGEDEIGTKITIHGSKVESQEAVATHPGTEISVKNLFYNVPARRKFLKSDAAEYKHILSEFNQVALAHPEIAFELYHNDKRIIKLPSEERKKRVLRILGKKFEDKIIPISEDTEIVNISGYLTTTDVARSIRGDQYLYINSRYFKSAYLQHAVSSAYANLIPDDKHPSYVLYLEADPSRVDINVHPTKKEVKFEDDRIIYNYIKAAARHAIAKHHMLPVIDFDTPPAFLHGQRSNSSGLPMTHTREEVTSGWQNLYEGLHRAVDDRDQSSVDMPTLFGAEVQAVDHPGQIATALSGYIIKVTPQGVMMVDQVAAHVRVLFDRYLKCQQETPPVQKLLFPETVDLTTSQFAAFEEAEPVLRQSGFDVTAFGQQAILIHGVPAFHQIVPINSATLVQIIDEISQDTDASVTLDERVALACARKSAISRNQQLSAEESTWLMEALFASKLPDRTPDGRLCYVVRSREDIQQEFEKPR